MTRNVMSSGQSVMRRPVYTKSNVELVNGLRANISLHQHHFSALEGAPDAYKQWTAQEADSLYIPVLRPRTLSEPRASYDITVKLFYLPGIPASRRCRHTREAIDLVLKELGVQNIDLLIVSFPGVTFDADDDGEDEISEDASADSDDSEGLDAQVKSWKVLEDYHDRGIISQLGVSEFSSDRLDKFLPEVSVRPTVDQINVKDCCVVPKALILYAKEKSIELLTHNDCMDILPCGTTRELLSQGESGAKILASTADAPDSEPGLKGNIEPQWVIKYTAVVKDRGVVENKGYYAVAQLGESEDGLMSTSKC